MTIDQPDPAFVGPLEAKLSESSWRRNCNDQVLITDSTPGRVAISFQRTVRVPDNQGENYLPPGLGTFPLYSVRNFQETLPATMAAKGGLFFPMYQREAMWVNISASIPFAIQIYVGGVNAVSGEPIQSDHATTLRRLNKLAKDESIQDYVVAPKQL
ncbi:MAG: hypothetical protein Q9226_005253 [Calogaya cf. arnoldii]